ncbi:MAG: DUF2971 domain-containing protein [Boseongicola sp.]|nr:DUF2971 domain-containing protein [Boseongicola sp.]
MEGFRDVVWKGDDIVWTNLFRHYVSCLNLTVVLAMVQGDDVAITPDDIPVQGLAGDHPPPLETTILDELCAVIFDRCKLPNLIRKLSTSRRPVRREELLLYLMIIHFVAIEEVRTIHVRHGITCESTSPRVALKPPINPDVIPTLIARLCNEEPDIAEEFLAALNQVSKHIYENIILMKKYDASKSRRRSATFEELNREFIVLDFPRAYVSQLDRLTCPDWCVACFVEDCRNSSVWGHYGDNHKGAALMFKAEGDLESPALTLGPMAGVSSSPSSGVKHAEEGMARSYGSFQFHRINYDQKVPELDFFRSLGVPSLGRLIDRWYTSEEGKRSKCADHLSSHAEDSWREEYWDKFYGHLSSKNGDWAYERERRIVLTSLFSDLREPMNRKLTYRFESLAGIIFGINMPDETKVRIIDMVAKKCQVENRKSFDFFQAYYNHETGTIEKQKLDVKLTS